jgi:thiamine pyrophosphokinase
MHSDKKTAIIITNHAPDEIISGYTSLSGDIFAVDQGLQKIRSLGLKPSYIIGDFDSLDESLLLEYQSTPIIRHKTEKNETDTELALQFCVESGKYDKILICNDMQGRFDHALAIAQNLYWLHGLGMRAAIECEDQRIFFLDRHSVLSVPQNTLLSLIPWSDYVFFEYSLGLAYPLDLLKISKHQSRGISNVCLESEIEIALESGTVLAILTYQ